MRAEDALSLLESDQLAGIPKSPHTLLDLRASYPVNETFEVYGRVENAFDDDYETTRNYGSPGRGVYAGVRARF